MRKSLVFLMILLVILPVPVGARSTMAATLITITGTISGPGGPVANVWVGVNSGVDWQTDTTDGSGAYSVTIETEGEIWFHVRPDDTLELAQINLWRDGVTGNLTQDFTLVDGHLLDLQITGTGGQVITEPLWLDVMPLENMPPEHQWYEMEWDGGPHRYRAWLPYDIHYVTVHDPPPGYYETTRAFDLRTTDAMGSLDLNTSFVPSIPYDPPDATQITVGAPDLLGEATVTGGPGAALPLARVFLVNLQTAHQAYTISNDDGSFSAEIYAPPGSSLMIKHGPASHRWSDLEVGVAEMLNPFPGTIVNVPHAHSATVPALPFAAVGAIEQHIDDVASTHNYVGAAWAITGTMGPLVAEGTWTRILSGTYDGANVPGLYLGGLNWTHPALADLDDDGDLDLIVGERSGRLVHYENVGSVAIPEWRFVTDNFAGVDTGGWAYPALADLTGDGAPDLVVGAGSGSVRVYYNEGDPDRAAWPETPDVTLAAGNNAAPTLEDIDGDSLLDLMVGHEGGTLYHFENTGNATVPTWTLRDNDYGGFSESDGFQPAFLDLDGDNDHDLLVGLNGSLIWYERNGANWTRHASDPIGYGGGSSATSPGVGDWNGDGALDLFTGEHWGNLRFFWVDPPDSWSEEVFDFPFELAGDTAPALTDWNNDGSLDLLIGQAHGRIEQYTNVGNSAAPDWWPDGPLLTLPWTNHPHAYPAFADVDGDNLIDLFVGEGNWDGPEAGGNIRHYRNTGSPSTPNWQLQTTDFLGLNTGGWATPVFADLDDDGDLDLLAGSGPGPLTFVERTPTGWETPVSPYLSFDLGAYTAPALLDVDEDGDLDLLVGLENGTLAYVRNTGTASTPAWALVTTTYAGIDVGDHAVPAAADVDGDGDDDLLIGDGDGGLNLYRYEGPGTPPTGDVYEPGDEVQVSGHLRLYSTAIDGSTDVDAIRAYGGFSLMMTHAADGRAIPAESYFMSSLLTPSGFPVQGQKRPFLEDVEGDFAIEAFNFVGGHAVEAPFAATFRIPHNAPEGLYRPALYLWPSNVPTSTDWLAANVTYHTFSPDMAALPPLRIGMNVGARSGDRPQLDYQSGDGSQINYRLTWRLLNDTYVQGMRGTGAREDDDVFGLASQIVTQGAPYYAPLNAPRTGEPISYRLEPFLPAISFTDRRMPTPPLFPFDLPGGSLHVIVQEPDGTVTDLGSETFTQSFNRTPTTRGGGDLNSGTVQQDDVYSLMASDDFRVTFDQYGHHVVTMTGQVSDLWGNTYEGGGTYDLWMAEPLDVHPGVLPGTPLAVGDTFNPALRVYPRVPADVEITFTLYPDSDPNQAIVQTFSGRANDYGYFSGEETGLVRDRSELAENKQNLTPIPEDGEYRVDLVATYTDDEGVLHMGTMTWGGVVMTPPAQAYLVAHGRRGVDSLESIPGSSWFVACRDLNIPADAVSHTFNPYFKGDVVWSRMEDAPGECPANVTSGGDSLLLGSSVHDTTGAIEAAIQSRAMRMSLPVLPPGDLMERMAAQELPLFISTLSGEAPQLVLGRMDAPLPADVDQIAYSYRVSQRPGVRVREVVAEDAETGGYWRLDTLYDDQLGVGVLGDQPNDFKFQYVGTVYRDLTTGHTEYGGHGSAWIFIPDDDTTGSRVMPPFAGFGGWTNEGGPLLTLKGEDVHIFILPTGVRPGEILEVGDRFLFAGHIMPTLDSRVAVTVTSPGGTTHVIDGQANDVGYFYDSNDDFTVNEAGLWTVDVRIWHDGECSGGNLSLPYPDGDVLGSEAGRYVFYVVPQGATRLDVISPTPGFLEIGNEVTPITVTGTLPAGLTGASVDYTLTMAGYILERGQAILQGDTYEVVVDPVALNADFPNLDLVGRDDGAPGLADTIAVNLLLEGENGGATLYRANAVTLQGERVYVDNGRTGWLPLYLPMVLRE